MKIPRPARAAALAAAVQLVVPVALLGDPDLAHAQAKKPLREQLPLEARGHWDAAVALAGRAKWDAARASFMAAYDMSKNPRVLYNVGIAEKNLERYGAAIETFQRELAEGKGQLSADEEKELRQIIEQLGAFVGTVSIQVSEPDAEVFVGDEKVETARLAKPLALKTGSVKVRAVKPGFAEAVETVNVAPKANTAVSLKLQALVKTARVNVAVVGPANAIVKIDRKEVGPAPYAGLVTVTADPHEFSAEAPGYVPATQTALVKEGETLNLTLQLAIEQEKGKLSVIAKPEGSSIEIDGKFAGATKWEGPVDARTHQIVVKKPGYYTWSYDVDVPRGGERTVTASLNEDRNTSYVPWLVGTIVVGAALVVGVVLLATPPDEPLQPGTLNPFTVGTQSMRGFRF